MTFLYTGDLSGNYSAAADICSRIRVSTRVGGYMRGDDRERNIRYRGGRKDISKRRARV